MIIKSLTLCGNRRLLPADIKYLHLDFTLTHQIILGLNGSGKSTTIQELNPMPAVPADYIKGGYKRIVIEHNKQTYELTSLIAAQIRHHFVLNGVELNDGGTAAVQKILVKEHFNLDQELIEILTDQTRFHLMSPLERRSWLTRLSGSNMDYALGFFKHLKNKLRDTDAVIKHLDTRLAQESVDMMDEQNLAFLEQECRAMENHVLMLLEHKNSNRDDPELMCRNLETLSQQLQKGAHALLDTSFVTPHTKVKDPQSLQAYVLYETQRSEQLQQERSVLLKQWQQITEAIKTIANCENKDREDIQVETGAINTRISAHRSRIKHYPDVGNPVAAWAATDAVRHTLASAIDALPDNSDRHFNRERVTASEAQLSALNQQMVKLGIEIDNLKLSIHRMTQIDDVSCPECHAQFKPGVDPKFVEELQARGREKSALMDQLKTEVETHQQYLNEAQSYRREYHHLVSVMKDTPNLTPLWQNLRLIDLTSYHPSVLHDGFNTWCRELQEHLLIHECLGELAHLNQLTEQLEAVQASKVNYSQSRLEEVSAQLSALDQNIRDNQQALDRGKTAQQCYTRYAQLYQSWEGLMTAFNARMQGVVDSYAQADLDELLRQLNRELATTQQRVQDARAAFNNLQHLEAQKSQLLEKRELLKAMVKEMNPTDGLIAEQSKLFIEQFVDQLNKVINAVWTYEMQILPCPSESDKLTYKFPIYFPATQVATQDIAKSSAAQKGIVDFAFKLVVMVYLGLQEYPLYLDELAPSLDEKHRSNIMAFVKNFIEAKQCSQMFMVSHYVSGFGVFQSAEVAVLDDTNILTLPQVYNRHLTIGAKMIPFEV